MPRHVFSFPKKIRKAVRQYVSNAVALVDPLRYSQEPAYTAALAKELEGIAYSGPLGEVKFISTIVNDRGPGAAEKWSGADLAITAEISDEATQVRKAI